MSLLSKLERKFGHFAVPNVTFGLIVCQVVVFIIAHSQHNMGVPEPLDARLSLIPDRVLSGEVWRLVTFLAVPPIGNIVCALFFWYLFYLMGTALELNWGTFRYNVYLLIGYLATVGVSFLRPESPASNAYLQGSVFLAFAFLFPDFELYLFFLLPVKIKWLALLTWVGYFVVLLTGDGTARLLVLVSVCNFLVFFSRDVVDRAAAGRRRMAAQAARFAVREPDYYHRCTVCGITDRSHPKMEFRYCSKCAGNHGYCSDHLHDHQHVTESGVAAG